MIIFDKNYVKFDINTLRSKHNILQPYDILGGHTICDFFVGRPNFIKNKLKNDKNKYYSKPTLLSEFLGATDFFKDIKKNEPNELFKPFLDLGLYISPHELQTDLNYNNSIH